MSISSWYVNQCSNPNVKGGRFILSMMDIVHRPFIDWAIASVSSCLHGNILEIGTGSGYGLSRLSGYGKVYGIDISDVSVRLSRKRAAADVVRACAEDIPFSDGFFDVVISFDSFCYWDADEALPEIRRVLGDNGIVIIALEAADPSAAPAWIRKSGMITLRSPDEIKEILSAHGFRPRVVKRYGPHAVIAGHLC